MTAHLAHVEQAHAEGASKTIRMPGNQVEMVSSGLAGEVRAGGLIAKRIRSIHSLAKGPGVNPLGDEALSLLPDWSAEGPCVVVESVEEQQ